MLKGKKILLGITGSIAAYKIAMLTRLLIKSGAEVKIIMTRAAKDFVTPVTLSTLSKNDVLSDLTTNDSWANHVALGRWADVMIIAPLSCNTLAKMATGLCDNLLMAVYLSATCPVVLAPAMDEDMWQHASTQRNLQVLREYGNHILPVEFGELASGLTGSGRMSEPENIIKWLEHFFLSKNELKDKKVLITAGPTYEPIDPVRFIGNHSSGKMGIALANEFRFRGADVTLVLGPSDVKFDETFTVKRVQTAAEMLHECENVFQECHIAVMCAAVADYTAVNVSAEKIKKSDAGLSIELKRTTDILKLLGSRKSDNQVLVGFALETENEKENALKKLQTKNADLIVLNSLNDDGAGFKKDTNKITIFGKNGTEQRFETKTKREVAADIINSIIEIIHEKN